jgi:hypothetical protein
MDWVKAIERNRVALAHIVAEIIALVGWVSGGRLERLPRGLYLAAERLLRPTESALRRLIVIAARGVVVKTSAFRPMTQGKVIAAGARGRVSFPLFDARKNFDFIEVKNPLVVMVKTYSSNPFNLFEQINPRRTQDPVDRDYTLSFARRLAAVKQALETLPQQAQRMARWQAKRKTMDKPKFISPLRPGRPPGYRGEPDSKIDFILQEMHGLANDALSEDTS